MTMYAEMKPNPDHPTEILIEVYDRKGNHPVRLVCWAGYDPQDAYKYLVFTPQKPFKKYSVKQEKFFKVFTQAAILDAIEHGSTLYDPKNPYDCFKHVYPPSKYGFDDDKPTPVFDTIG